MTIRKRLTLWYAALLITIIVVFGTVTFMVVRLTMVDNLDNTLRESARQVMVNSRLVQIPADDLQPRVDVQLAPLDVFRASNVYVQAWEVGADRTEFQGASANLTALGDIPLDPDALGSDAEENFANVNIRDVELRVLTKPIFVGDQLVGNIQVAGDMATINQALDTLLLIMLISCGISIIGAGGVSMWFSHRALKPIEDITSAASNIAVANDLSTRLAWKGPQDELGKLISVFNHMMSRIEHLFNVQQRFIADMSHELRTPLTSIRGNMEIARRYGMDDASMEAIEIEAGRMSRLVNDLLMLARADYGGIVIEMEPTELESVLVEAFKQGQLLAGHRDLKFELGEIQAVRVNGNSNRIKQLLLNLLSNAINFTEDGGEINVSLTREGDKAVITVQDTGIGIKPEDIKHIFERFYQVDTARVHSGEGFGLGLSIARWITDAHKGDIQVDSTPNEGTTVRVLLPALLDAEPSEHVEHITYPTLSRFLRRNRHQNEKPHHSDPDKHYAPRQKDTYPDYERSNGD